MSIFFNIYQCRLSKSNTFSDEAGAGEVLTMQAWVAQFMFPAPTEKLVVVAGVYSTSSGPGVGWREGVEGVGAGETGGSLRLAGQLGYPNW